MKFIHIPLLAIALLYVAQTRAQEQKPSPDPSAALPALDSQIKQIAADFEAKSKKIADDTARDAGNIKPDEASNVEMAINFDIDVKWEMKSFRMDLPEIKLVDRRIALDLPQVTLTNKRMSFDVPETKMETKKIGEKPEVTVRWRIKNIGLGIKTNVPETVVTMTPIYADVPVIWMSRKDIVLSVPEFKMERSEFVLAIPEFAMKPHDLKISLPEFTIRNPRAEIKKATERASALEADSKKQLADAKQTFTSQMEQVVTDGIHQTFADTQAKLTAQAESVQKQLAAARTLTSESINGMRVQGMQDSNPALQDAIMNGQRMEEGFQTALNQLKTQLEQLIAQEKKAIEDALKNHTTDGTEKAG